MTLKKKQNQLNIVFCGTPEFAIPSLEALNQDPDFVIQKVFTQPDQISGRGQKLQTSPVKTWSLKRGLKVAAPEKISTKDVILEVKQNKWEMAVVVAFGQILSKDFLNAFPRGCVNIHSSLLPRWRGAAPVERAIMAGDSKTGVTLQKIEEKLDAGDIIGTGKIELTENMGAIELYEKLSRLGADLLTRDLKSFLKGDIKAIPQDETQATYARKILKQEGRIDWKNSAFEIHNKIRALNRGGPFATTSYRKKTLKLHQSHRIKMDHEAKPGEIIDLKKESLIVSCGQDTLELLVVQPESKSKMKIRDFICGYHPQKGDCFE